MALALAGCAHSGAPQPSLESSGQVVGSIAIPEGTTCDTLSVTATNEAGVALGRAYVRQSRNRCSYEVLNLPTAQALNVAVSSASGCSAAPKGNATVTLAQNATRLVDFALSCDGSSGAAATK